MIFRHTCCGASAPNRMKLEKFSVDRVHVSRQDFSSCVEGANLLAIHVYTCIYICMYIHIYIYHPTLDIRNRVIKTLPKTMGSAMRTSRTRPCSLACAFLIQATTLMAQDNCVEGTCQESGNNDNYLLCGSQMWHSMPSNGYLCVSGVLVPPVNEQTIDPGLKSTQINTQIVSTQTMAPADEQSSLPLYSSGVFEAPSSPITSSKIQSMFVPQAWKPSRDTYGTRSYTVGGKMASVYDAESTSTFRCDGLSYPPDGYYVAFYTRYENTLEVEKKSQPEPVNCGQYVSFTNPMTGVSATAMVLDRCASCIGVGGQLNDPNTDQSLVNGATVDFGRALWNKIYNNAPDNVYDVQYVGEVLQGMA